jgi:lipoprotein-releasing system ATP-binding protein
MTTAHKVLQMHHVYKNYRQGGKILPVLNDISVSFNTAHSYAVTGVSGSGKSTLLHVLGSLDIPTSGTVTFNSHSIQTMKPSAKNQFLNTQIGFVFQFHYLVKELCVFENIMFMGMVRGESKKKCRVRAEHLLELVGLFNKKTAYPTQLSGGEQQRVAIARALFNKPAFLLADEPTGNLDADNAARIVDILFSAQQEWGMGIIICSHDPAVFNRMGMVYKMHEGSLIVR